MKNFRDTEDDADRQTGEGERKVKLIFAEPRDAHT